MRTTYDFAPLWRSTIGFDRLFDLVDAAQQAGTEDNYPPCNVERLDRARVDEVERRTALHLDRRAGVVRQHHHRGVRERVRRHRRVAHARLHRAERQAHDQISATSP